ncbi:helix-turn-helix transcriptional regulator [candidate division KSB1 bacterium]|nr:helix-turn-helix transcriptional regulator [candidate division KSB1 bacterium]
MKHRKFRQSIHSKANKALRELLINQRNKLSLTQRDLAEQLNVSRSLIGKIETGDRRLDIIELLEYANHIQIDCDTIISTINKFQEITPPQKV